jgi:imidazolonepropionase-like amidohydrolase
MKCLFLLLLPLQLLSQQSYVLVKSVNVVDVQTGKIVTKRNVLITGNRIQKITSKTVDEKDATVVNGAGKFLIPVCGICMFTYLVMQ